MFGVEHRKLSNQARFVTEIIENKLIVSKKSKQKLVEELRKKGYEAFPKVKDAKRVRTPRPVASGSMFQNVADFLSCLATVHSLTLTLKS